MSRASFEVAMIDVMIDVTIGAMIDATSFEVDATSFEVATIDVTIGATSFEVAMIGATSFDTMSFDIATSFDAMIVVTSLDVAIIGPTCFELARHPTNVTVSIARTSMLSPYRSHRVAVLYMDRNV
jgi:hypothetical protein